MSEEKKPGIVRLYDAMSAMEQRNIRIMKEEKQSQWPKRFAESLLLLQVEFEQMGIAQHFDWTE